MAEIIATNAYRTQLAARAVSGAATLVPYKVAFGTGTTSESPDDTVLESEFLRVDPDSVTSDGVTLTVMAIIDATQGAGNPITEIGIFADNGGSDILMGRKVFTAKTIVDPDSSQFNVTFTY